MVKTKIALSHKKSKEANILLMEEPENHFITFEIKQANKSYKK